MSNNIFLDMVIEKHQEKFEHFARYIAGNYEPPRDEKEVYTELIDAIKNGRGDIIQAWRFGYIHPKHIPLTPAASGFIAGELIILYNFMQMGLA